MSVNGEPQHTNGVRWTLHITPGWFGNKYRASKPFAHLGSFRSETELHAAVSKAAKRGGSGRGSSGGSMGARVKPPKVGGKDGALERDSGWSWLWRDERAEKAKAKRDADKARKAKPHSVGKRPANAADQKWHDRWSL